MKNETLELGVPETTKLVCELVQSELNVPPGIVQIYNQKRRLPPAKGFFVDVSIIGDHPFGVKRGYVVDPASQDLVEQQSVAMQEVIQIDIFSYDDSARLNKIKLLFALTGTAAQQIAERWALKIGRIPSSFVDASEVEGSARLNRYALTFNVTRAYAQAKSAPTFTQFTNPPNKILVDP